MNYTDKYLALAQEEPIVSVTAPSGFVFKFKALKTHFYLTKLKRLPQSLASAVSSDPKNIDAQKIAEQATPEEAAQMSQFVADTIEYILERSYEPKLVAGEAVNDGEMPLDVLSQADFDFLFQWFVAGGSGGSESSFPSGQESKPLASASRPKRRATAK